MAGFLSGALATPAINAIGNVGSSFLGGLFGANEAAKNRDFQLEMWNRQNEYNKPSAWRARMEEAGFNPYNALDGGSGLGQSVSMPQGSQAAGFSPHPMNLASDISSVAGAFASIAQARKQISETTGQDIENMFLPSLLGGKIDYRNLAIGKSGYWDKDRGYVSASLDQSKEYQELRNMEYAMKLTAAQESLTNLRADAQGIMNKYLDADNQANLMIKAQNYVNLVKQGALTEAQAVREIASTVETYARAKGQSISNEVAQQTASAVIASTIATNSLSAKEARTDMLNFKQLYKNKYNKSYFDSRFSEKQVKNFDSNARMKRWSDFTGGVGNLVGSFRGRF